MLRLRHLIEYSSRARVGSGDETMNTFPVSVGGIMLNFFSFYLFIFYLSNKLCPKFAYWKEHRKQGGSSFTAELQDCVTSSLVLGLSDHGM